MKIKKLNIKSIAVAAAFALGIISVFPAANTYASYAYAWTVNGERIQLNGANESGNVRWVQDDNYTGGILELTSYNGGQLRIECFGTDIGHVFAIKLIGDNYVTVEDGVGIIANQPVSIIGDGKLTIKALEPIGQVDSNGAATFSTGHPTTVTIEPAKSGNNSDIVTIDGEVDSEPTMAKPEEKEDDTKDCIDSEKSFLDNPLISIILLSYCAIISTVLVIMIIKLKSSKKES